MIVAPTPNRPNVKNMTDSKNDAIINNTNSKINGSSGASNSTGVDDARLGSVATFCDASDVLFCCRLLLLLSPFPPQNGLRRLR